ncbi:MAG: NAD(P)-dependent oxidoreductase [Candidatus Poribacteria bacterium]
MSPQKVLITGVYGLIGNIVYARLAENPDKYDVYGLTRRNLPSERISLDKTCMVPENKFHLADLGDFSAIQQAVSGIDVVVHMAADASGAKGWQSILPNNVIGTYNVFEACRIAKVKRIIYASSIQVNNGYRTEEPYSVILDGRIKDIPEKIPLMTSDRVTRPLNLYACSKAWGEALAHTYSASYGMSCICLRIGWVVDDDRPPKPMSRSVWCSKRDMVQLVECCINANENIRFDVFFGVSDNRYRWVDIEHAKEAIGYIPQDKEQDYE